MKPSTGGAEPTTRPAWARRPEPREPSPSLEADGAADAPFDARDYLADVGGVLSWRVLQVVAVTLLIALTEGLSLLLLAPLLELTGLDLGASPISRVAAGVEWAFATLGLRVTLVSVIAAYVSIVALRALFTRWGAMSNFRLRQRFTAKLRERLHSALIRADWLFFVKRRSSDFMHKLTRELETVAQATFGLLEWAVTLLLTAVYLAYAVYLSPAITLVVLAAGVTLNLLLRLEMRRARPRGVRLSSAYEEFYAAISDHFSGMKTAKSHGVESAYEAHFLRTARAVEQAQVAVVANQRTVGLWLQLGATVILAAAIYLAVGVIALAAANVLLLLYLFARLMPMFSRLQSGYHSFLGSIPAYENVRRLESECAAAAESIPQGADRLSLSSAVELVNVSFSYRPGVLAPVLEGLSLRLEAGKTTALVGPSGAGKSTVADLVIGLLEPNYGQLLVDGTPLDGERLQRWRRSLGYVAQDTFIFHDTVRANLTITQPDADDEAISEAVGLAAAEFLLDLPEGLDTVLGDRGVRLSGGERQRLALARALLRRPTLLVLDEATSSLDVENERRIQAAVEGLRGLTTILVIAHRLSTVRDADTIHVLEGGRVAESGGWQQLFAMPKSRLKELYRAQALDADETPAFGRPH